MPLLMLGLIAGLFAVSPTSAQDLPPRPAEVESFWAKFDGAKEALEGGRFADAVSGFEACLADIANYNGEYVYGAGVKGEDRQRTTLAGFFGARGRNAFGLYDMHGNVWEYCWDWYDGDFYEQGKWPTDAQGERVDPTGPQTGSYRVLRGGSWSLSPRYLRSANRNGLLPSFRGIFGGFNLTLDSEEPFVL